MKNKGGKGGKGLGQGQAKGGGKGSKGKGWGKGKGNSGKGKGGKGIYQFNLMGLDSWGGEGSWGNEQAWGGDDWGAQPVYEPTGYLRSLASLDGYTPAVKPVCPSLMTGKGNASVSTKNSFDALGEHCACPMNVPILDLVVESRRKVRN